MSGDPNSLSDTRLKSERNELSGQQAQNILNQITSYTYEREDIGERRLGLIADEVESAIEELAIDNVVSTNGTKMANIRRLIIRDSSVCSFLQLTLFQNGSKISNLD